MYKELPLRLHTKISLARGLAKKTKLILLDEQTSSLDNISEKYIINKIISYDIPCICVSHRLSTIKHFDKIILINDGIIL